MANTYYDSQLTAEEIENALEAIDGVIAPANNGKVLAIENGKIIARSVVWPGGGTLEPLSVTQNGDYYPGTDIDGFDEVHVNVSSSGITKIQMESCAQQCYLYTGGNRGWAVYPTVSGAQNSETFYADIPNLPQNGGLIILSTERPDGASYSFTRNRIGFTNGAEDPDDLPSGESVGRTTQPSFYMNAMSINKDKQFSFVKVPSGMSRVYWTNTQGSYRVAGQKSYMWLISNADFLNALNIDWRYYLLDSITAETTPPEKTAWTTQ